MNKINTEIQTYRKYRNLKIAANELDIPWQTLYAHLIKNGEPVIGDKKRYGSTSDKLAYEFESRFKRLVPFAIENNSSKFQAKIDFFVGGYSVDVKVSSLQKKGVQPSGKKFSSRWAYCISKQKNVADFFVLYALNADGLVGHVFLIPKEIAITSSTISIPLSMKSKWSEYKLSETELLDFFKQITPLRDAA